jgi:multidrug efflux pump subunit AcrA (membrane-fusion protein)
MRKEITAFLLVFMMAMLGTCAKQPAANVKARPVKTVTVKEEIRPKLLSYIGIVKPEELKKLSYKSSGKIGKVYVEEGEFVKKGQILAELDKRDLQLAMEASKNQLEAVKAQYDKAVNGAQAEDIKNAELSVEKAQDAYSYSQDNYKKAQKLYESGMDFIRTDSGSQYIFYPLS